MFRLFNETIKSKLKEKNKSLRELCRESGIDPSFLSKVLKNKRNPPSDEKVLRKIAVSLGINPVKLVIYTGRIPEKHYELFCSDKFIDWIDAGAQAQAAGKNPPDAARRQAEKKQFPADKPGAGRVMPGRAEMSEELL